MVPPGLGLPRAASVCDARLRAARRGRLRHLRCQSQSEACEDRHQKQAAMPLQSGCAARTCPPDSRQGPVAPRSMNSGTRRRSHRSCRAVPSLRFALERPSPDGVEVPSPGGPFAFRWRLRADRAGLSTKSCVRRAPELPEAVRWAEARPQRSNNRSQRIHVRRGADRFPRGTDRGRIRGRQQRMPVPVSASLRPPRPALAMPESSSWPLRPCTKLEGLRARCTTAAVREVHASHTAIST